MGPAILGRHLPTMACVPPCDRPGPSLTLPVRALAAQLVALQWRRLEGAAPDKRSGPRRPALRAVVDPRAALSSDATARLAAERGDAAAAADAAADEVRARAGPDLLYLLGPRLGLRFRFAECIWHCGQSVMPAARDKTPEICARLPRRRNWAWVPDHR